MIGLDFGDVGSAIPALAGIAYLGLALRATADLPAAAPPPEGPFPPLTVFKPLCGAEPRLYECLRSFCDQDYPDFHLVFGVHSDDDPAIAVVERLRAEFPACDITLVSSGCRHGPNMKIGNLINMRPAGRHDVLAFSDSDVEISRDTLRHAVAGFRSPEVGAVSCLYRGRPTAGRVSRLGALAINAWTLPAILLDRRLNGIEACLGPLLLIRSKALAAIGGFESVADHLAEDHEIGERLHRAGWQVRLSLLPIDTMVDETRLSDLIRHEVRWAHTVRAVRPLDHALSLATVPLPLILLMLALFPGWTQAALLALYLGLRVVLTRRVEARVRSVAPLGWWWLPVRECLSFWVWAVSLLSRGVEWRGQSFRLVRGGRLIRVVARAG